MRKSDLVDRLKRLYEKGNKDTTLLSTCTMAGLRQLVKEEEASWLCPACSQEYIVLKWDSGLNIKTCNNSVCMRYRNPAGSIRR